MDGYVFVWGSARRGQLADACSSSALPQPKPIPAIEGNKFVHAAGGDEHTLLVSDDGNVYSMGRGREGQLGLGSRLDVREPTRIESLNDEVVEEVCCGALHSACRTNLGRVYLWGLIHEEEESRARHGQHSEGEAAQGGGQGGQEVAQGEAVDAAAAGDARTMLGVGAGNETLQRIVRESTSRWLTAREDGEEERGHDGEEMTRELGIVQMDARRRAVAVPRMAMSLLHSRIHMLSAGFGHTLALSDDGKVYAAGYNDRGQLGLGHRVNCAEFQHIKHLDGVFCLKVAAGQQHNLARVREPNGFEAVYVWGNGSLGQLGLGVRVSGKRVPTRVRGIGCDRDARRSMGTEDVDYQGVSATSATRGNRATGGSATEAEAQAELQVVDVAAGANHSVCVTSDGSVYSWGHAEYGQHGYTTSVSKADLLNARYFYVPRRVQVDAEFAAVACGACFTLATTSSGEVWSWGWNSYGCLGHGKGHFSNAPLPIQTLKANDRRTLRVFAGYKHGIALVDDSGSPSAMQLRHLLQDQQTCDVILALADDKSRARCAHRVILEARCPYLRGFLSSAINCGDATLEPVPHGAQDDDDDDKADGQERSAWRVTFDFPEADHITTASLLHFLYTDRLSVPPHKVRKLMMLAQTLHLERLEALCRLEHDRQAGYHTDQPVVGGSSASRASAASEDPQATADKSPSSKVPTSTFETQLAAVVGDPRLADVFLAVGPPESSNTATVSDGQQGIWAHEPLLLKIEYFRSLLGGKFKHHVFQSAFARDVKHVDISGFIEDGIQLSTLQRVVTFIYTGSEEFCIPKEDPGLVSELVVAAERIGVLQLVRLCEKHLVAFVQSEPSNAVAFGEFADRYHLHRLSRQCRELGHGEAMSQSSS